MLTIIALCSQPGRCAHFAYGLSFEYMEHGAQLNREEHEGEKYLQLLGLEELADQQIPGRAEQVRDFLDICGDHARPMLVGFESLSPDDPRYERVRDALRTQVAQFLNISLEA